VKLRITLAARYFGRYRLCVTAPTGERDCRRFRIRRGSGGLFGSSVLWAKHFPGRGPGTYHARWRSGGAALGPRVSFAEGPTIRTSPDRVAAGNEVRVFGLAGGCPEGDQVTLISPAFPDAQEFAGVPAVDAVVDAHDRYSVRVQIPSERTPGRYTIGARCGGGNLGVTGSLMVLPPGP
jgi:hypothetical protein